MDQGLPIAFENTAQTWQNMPGMAAFYTGRQNQIAQDNIAALQKAFEAEQAYKAQSRPVELQNLIKSGVLTEAQARHADALTRASGLASDELQQTMPGRVSSINATNSAKTAEQEQAEHMVKTTRLAAWLNGPGKNVPTFLQAQEFMKTFGIQDSPDGKVSQKIVSDMPKLSKLLEAEAKKAWELSGSGQQTLVKEAGDTARNAATNAANIRGHEIAAGAVRDAAATRANTKVKDFVSSLNSLKKASDRRAALITEAARIKDTDPELSALYSQMADDPRLVTQAQADLAAAAQATVTPGPNGPVLGTRQEGVQLSPNPIKPGTTIEYEIKDGKLVKKGS